MDIYLDINGVVLKNNLEPAPHLEEFITKISNGNNLYWLTTHCKGNSNETLKYLSWYLPASNLKLLEKVKPTNWGTLKTEAINFEKDFLWFDDSILATEKAVLEGKGKLDSWVQIDLNSNPNQLNDFLINNVFDS